MWCSLDFGITNIWIQDKFFHFPVIERYGVLSIKYELKKLRMDVF